MAGRVSGKKALITGAARGIGAAAAWALAREGAKVVLTDINETQVFREAAAINADLGADTAFALVLDVTRESDWQRALPDAARLMDGLSVLVNNAGLLRLGSIEDISLDDWRRGFAVNVDGPFLGMKHALPILKDHQPGSIINMSSIAGLIAGHNLANYNASKAALWLLSKSVALHCARQGWDVRCNSIHPTFIRTDMLKDIVGDRDEETALAKLAKQVPLGRIGEAMDIANAIVYLASDESRFMTGAELKLDGGISAM